MQWTKRSAWPISAALVLLSVAGCSGSSAPSSEKSPADAARSALGGVPPLQGTSITTSDAEGSVKLSGTVKNMQQKELAESVAKQASGGKAIINELQVQGG